MKLIELNISPAQIKRSVQLGWGAAVISAASTILFTFIATSGGGDNGGLRIWALTSAIATVSLADGVYRRSRRAAVTLLVLFIVSRAWYYAVTGSFGVPILMIIFLYCFVEGVRGTFAHHHAVQVALADPNRGAA